MRVENEKQVRILFYNFFSLAKQRSCRAESHDCEISGAMGQAQGVGEAQARSQSGRGGSKRSCS